MGQAKRRGNREERVAQALEQAERGSRAVDFSIHTRAALLEKDYVQSFCEELDSAMAAVSVPCQPAAGRDFGECFTVVERKVAEAGGKFVLGWAIWERPGIWLEAELHAVWQNPEGELIDIVPRAVRFKAIAFLPDSKGLSYARQVDNVRQPLSPDPRTVRLIELCKEEFALLNEGDLADQFGAITLPPDGLRKYNSIQRERAEIERYFLRETELRK